MDSPELPIAVPRTYRLQTSPTWNIFYCAWALLMIAGHWWPVLFAAKRPGLSDYLFSIGYVLIACISINMTFRSFVRLTEDSIKISRFWRSKELPFDKIKGRRRYTEKADPYSTPARHLVLDPNDERFPRLDIKVSDKFDENFYRWFDSLLDLDKLDGKQASHSKYANFSLV